MRERDILHCILKWWSLILKLLTVQIWGKFGTNHFEKWLLKSNFAVKKQTVFFSFKKSNNFVLLTFYFREAFKGVYIAILAILSIRFVPFFFSSKKNSAWSFNRCEGKGGGRTKFSLCRVLTLDTDLEIEKKFFN